MICFKLTKKKVMEITYEEKHSLGFLGSRGRLLMQKQSSGHLNLFLALENSHIVNSLTGVVQMLPP